MEGKNEIEENTNSFPKKKISQFATYCTGLANNPIPQDYVFDNEDNPTNIKFKRYRPQIKEFAIDFANLDKLIEWVTHEKYNDLSIRTTFLYTYRIFSNPCAVINKLLARFFVPIPQNMTQTESDYFKLTLMKRIRIKVLSVMKNWVDEHFYDFMADESLLRQFEKALSFLKSKSSEIDVNLMMSSSPGNAISLVTQSVKEGSPFLLSPGKESGKALRGSMSVSSYRGSVVEGAKDWLSCFITHIENTIKYRMNDNANLHLRNQRKFIKVYEAKGQKSNYDVTKFFTIKVSEIAQQLALIDFDNFRKILPTELLNKNWESEDKHIKSPNVTQIISRSNKISHWIAHLIMNNASEKDLVKRTSFFIDLIETLENINDLCGMFDVLSGIKRLQIWRLKDQIWNKLSKKKNNYIDKCHKFFFASTSMHTVKRELRMKTVPCVPHVSFFTQDMFIYMEEFTRKQKKMKHTDLINIDLCSKMAERLSSIKRYQMVPFPFDAKYELLNTLIEFEDINEDVLDKLSYKIKPSLIDLNNV